MPIKTYCPDCDAPVTAPTSAVGDTVSCEECGSPVKMPRARPRRREDDDRDDRPRRRDRSDADDRPRPRGSRDRNDRPRKGSERKRRKKAAMEKRLIIGLAAGGLLVVLAVLGVGAWFLFLHTPADKTIDGEGWYKASGGDGLFTAYFPGGKPKYEKAGFQPPEFLARKAGKNADDMGFKVESWTRKVDGREYSIALFTGPALGAAPDQAERAAALARVPAGPGVTVLADEMTTVNGEPARRLATRGARQGRVSLTLGIGNRQTLILVVTGPDTLTPADPKVAAFFDNFTLQR
jgi:hypothetical protein